VGSYVCANFVKIDQEMPPSECSQTDTLTDTDRLTDANRFCNLSVPCYML